VAVDLDLAALKKNSLAPKQVVDAIDAHNLILPAGSARIGATEFDLTLNSSPGVLDPLNRVRGLLLTVSSRLQP
jgi:multidrug efflux pump subunit AcrB